MLVGMEGMVAQWFCMLMNVFKKNQHYQRSSSKTLRCFPASSSNAGSSLEVVRRKPWQTVSAPTPRLSSAMAGPLPKEASQELVLAGT
ncbi:hypothetical protein ACROYT_G030679 [Oculina patagonica]